MGQYRVTNTCDKPIARRRRRATPRGSSRVIKLGRSKILPRQKAVLSEKVVTDFFTTLKRAAKMCMVQVRYQKAKGDNGVLVDLVGLASALDLPHVVAGKAFKPEVAIPVAEVIAPVVEEEVVEEEVVEEEVVEEEVVEEEETAQVATEHTESDLKKKKKADLIDIATDMNIDLTDKPNAPVIIERILAASGE